MNEQNSVQSTNKVAYISMHKSYSIRSKQSLKPSIDTESTKVGGGSGGDDMEIRLSVLEEKTKNIETNTGEIKTDIREIRGNLSSLNKYINRWLFALLILGGGATLTLYTKINSVSSEFTKDLHSTELKVISIESKVDKLESKVDKLEVRLGNVEVGIKSIQTSLEKLTKDK